MALYYDAHGAKRTLRFLEWREFGVIDAVAKNEGIFALTESGAILHFSLPKSPRKQAETLTLDGQRGSPLVPAGFASSTTILAGNGEFLLSCAFGGVRVVGDELHVNPRLPEDWTELEAPLCWRGQALRMHAAKDGVTLCNQGQEAVDVVLCGNKQTVAPGQTVRA